MKKKLPLTVLRAIQPFYKRIEEERLVLDKRVSTLLMVKDADDSSDFFFEIIAPVETNKGLAFKCRCKPGTDKEVGEKSDLTILDHLLPTFNHWVKRVKEYESIKTHLDDLILKKYEEEFYNELESADEDATTASFNIKQQLLLDSALTKVIAVLESKKDETNEDDIAEMIAQAEEIQATVTESTKQEVLTKMSRLFAKIQKGGLKLIKDVYPIIQKEIIGAIVKTAVGAGIGIAGAAATHLLNS